MLNENFDSEAPISQAQPMNYADIDPVELANFFSEDLLYPIDDENFMLDTTQDLPIRKPQSAYVIFGKLVSIKKLLNVFLKKRDNIMRQNPGIKVTEVVK